MENLSKEIKVLKEKAYRLLHLGCEGNPVYTDDFAQLNREVQEQICLLYNLPCNSIEEEADLCVAVLMGYNGCIHANPADRQKRKYVFQRACRILDKLSPSLLKCQLLTYCYGELHKENWAKQVRQIIAGKENSSQSEEGRQIMETLKIMEASSL